ncbi:hypothetical protein M440DRAFT_1064309 [Trichoderma longibrachiatum ATCC 18648]|uniref:Uncharacterized protein n=1 Tax=Trichoderma longibrachiatum ATCC 18648 TaxID=983965 RepID=A0A2T4BW30_TRILO|nr:hypothetical protein M440DRAFT_1064309 [Trichoderma longibrachiatum ATCC 18648]
MRRHQSWLACWQPVAAGRRQTHAQIQVLIRSCCRFGRMPGPGGLFPRIRSSSFSFSLLLGRSPPSSSAHLPQASVPSRTPGHANVIGGSDRSHGIHAC